MMIGSWRMRFKRPTARAIVPEAVLPGRDRGAPFSEAVAHAVMLGGGAKEPHSLIWAMVDLFPKMSKRPQLQK